MAFIKFANIHETEKSQVLSNLKGNTLSSHFKTFRLLDKRR